MAWNWMSAKCSLWNKNCMHSVFAFAWWHETEYRLHVLCATNDACIKIYCLCMYFMSYFGTHLQWNWILSKCSLCNERCMYLNLLPMRVLHNLFSNVRLNLNSLMLKLFSIISKYHNVCNLINITQKLLRKWAVISHSHIWNF